MSNLEAAQSGDVVEALRELRDTLASDMDEAPVAVRAQIASQYRATLAELAARTPPEEKRGTVDELKERRERAGRRATSDASANA